MTNVATKSLSVRAPRKGLHMITREVANIVSEQSRSDGMCTVFIRHTSASLLITENADPDVRVDLEAYLNRLVPENEPYYRHTAEGPDDMPSHIKSALTQTSLSIPIMDGRLALGTWQGIYLWEHRTHPSTRTILVSVH